MTKNILIIEDNEKNMKLIRDVLQHHGFATITIGNAEEGVALAIEKLPDLIVMDIRLPGMSGNEAMIMLREDDRTSHISVIAVTASVMEEDKKKVKSAGFDGYLEKPFNYRELIALVKQLIEKDAS